MRPPASPNRKPDEMPSKHRAIRPRPEKSSHLQSLDLRDAEMADVSDIMLKTCAWACSKWFVLMRRIITRERSRQRKERDELGIAKGSSLPYVPQPMTAADIAASEAYESMLRITFGDKVADYAKHKFMDAIATGDMRSFKIRIVMLKARDALSGHCLHSFIAQSINSFISQAETLASCKPDNSPRRMSKSEKVMKQLKDEEKARRRKEQPELPLVWPGEEGFNTDAQDIEVEKVSESTIAPSPCPEKPDSISETENEHISEGQEVECDDIDKIHCVTVTGISHNKLNGDKCGDGCTGATKRSNEYESVDQILEDIEEGKIDPYESPAEICDDLKRGKISPVEALMFTAAMDVYMPSDEELSDQEIERDIEQELGSMEDSDELKAECDHDSDEENCDFTYEEVEDRRSGRLFSYNPRGFCGCTSGRYSTSGVDWNTDDET